MVGLRHGGLLRLFFVVSLLAVEGHVAWQDLLPAENWANVIRPPGGGLGDPPAPSRDSSHKKVQG